MRPSKAVPLLALLALFASAAPARAQVLIGYLFGEKLATPTFNMGFEVGVNFANLEGLDGDRMNRSVFGLFADWRFSEHVHFGGAVLPFAGRGTEDVAPVATGDATFDQQTAGSSMDRSLDYVEIPLILKWAPKRDEGIRVGVGPSLGIVTGAKDRYAVVSPAGMKYVLERDISGKVPGLDMGISFDVEYRIQFVSVAVRYTHGLTDMSLDGSPDAVHSHVLTGTGRIALGKKPAP
jgi:Outer membrane protein beta-barrel domain